MSDTLDQYAPPVPRAVRQQAEAANQAVKELQDQGLVADADPQTDADGRAVAPVHPEPPVTEPTRPVQLRDDGTGAAPSHTPESASADGWEQRYRSLQGKYSKEVPDLQQQLRTMQNTLVQLQAELAAKPPPAPPPRTPPPIDPEDAEAYGEELIQKARSWARAELAPEIEQLRHDVVRANGTAQNVAAQTAMNGVYAYMDANLPNWNTINTDDRFVNWLRGVDPLSGSVRQEMLTAAFTNGDARRTLSFFRAFLNEHTEDNPRQPGASQTSDGRGAATGDAGQVRLEDLAGPGRGAPASPGAPANKRIFTQKDITDFYSAVTKGRYAGREAEKDRMEHALHEAVYEGRVR